MRVRIPGYFLPHPPSYNSMGNASELYVAQRSGLAASNIELFFAILPSATAFLPSSRFE